MRFRFARPEAFYAGPLPPDELPGVKKSDPASEEHRALRFAFFDDLEEAKEWLVSEGV